jgi:hypothetical protein
MQAFTSDHHPAAAAHRFPVAKYALLREAVARSLPGCA